MAWLGRKFKSKDEDFAPLRPALRSGMIIDSLRDQSFFEVVTHRIKRTLNVGTLLAVVAAAAWQQVPILLWASRIALFFAQYVIVECVEREKSNHRDQMRMRRMVWMSEWTTRRRQ